jgi:hypothetical protein
MDIILTPARLTATTDLAGLRVECLSAPARGMAGDAQDGVGAAGATVAATTAVAVTTGGEVTSVDAATRVEAVMHAGRPEDTTAVLQLVVVDSAVVRLAAADFMVAAVSTVEVADTVAVVTAKFVPRLDLEVS